MSVLAEASFWAAGGAGSSCAGEMVRGFGWLVGDAFERVVHCGSSWVRVVLFHLVRLSEVPSSYRGSAAPVHSRRRLHWHNDAPSFADNRYNALISVTPVAARTGYSEASVVLGEHEGRVRDDGRAAV